MKNKKNRLYGMIATLIWFGVYIILVGNYVSSHGITHTAADMGTFMQDASVSITDDWVGANIWLKQAVHGTDGIKYRYVVKTDCPSWDFETRYMTDKPIEWIDETSAVQVIIHDARVYYEGTVYASGQYFVIPILDNLASESITYEEWQQNLVKQAYQAYVVDKDSDRMHFILAIAAGGVLPVILVIATVKSFPAGKWKKKENEKGA